MATGFHRMHVLIGTSFLIYNRHRRLCLLMVHGGLCLLNCAVETQRCTKHYSLFRAPSVKHQKAPPVSNWGMELLLTEHICDANLARATSIKLLEQTLRVHMGPH